MSWELWKWEWNARLEGSSCSPWTEKRRLAVCLSSCLPDCFGQILWFLRASVLGEHSDTKKPRTNVAGFPQRSISQIHCHNYALHVHIFPALPVKADKALHTQKPPSARRQKLVHTGRRERIRWLLRKCGSVTLERNVKYLLFMECVCVCAPDIKIKTICGLCRNILATHRSTFQRSWHEMFSEYSSGEKCPISQGKCKRTDYQRVNWTLLLIVMQNNEADNKITVLCWCCQIQRGIQLFLCKANFAEL